MKKQIKILITSMAILLIILILEAKVQAKSYHIEEMDIQAKIQENGDIEVEQTLEYSFNGDYNGIYITIPTKYENKEEVISKIDDSIYNAEAVVLKSVTVVEKNNNEITYKRVNSARNGQNGVFTEENNRNLYKLKIYSPSQNENKTFKVKYTLKNACVKHKDVGELYYNFIGGEWQCTIKKLTINLFLLNNTKEVKIWGHGPDNGVSKIINNTHVMLKVNNVPTGKYVAARLVFDKSNIPNAQKNSNIDAYELIYNQEQEIAKISDAKQSYTRRIYILGLILLVYWVVLLVKYENDKKHQIVNIKEEELFEKYNPMLAGCLQGSRDILARDIIAVILNLIDKKNIELDIKNTLEGKENYRYFINKVPSKEQEMDEIERYVYNWIFAGSGAVNLADALERLTEDERANEKFKKLNQMVHNRLNEKGANLRGVPKMLTIFNTILFIASIYISIKHVLFRGLEIYSDIDILMSILIIGFSILPFAMALLYIPLYLIVAIRQKVTQLIHKITGQRVVTTAVTIIAISLIIIMLTASLTNPSNRYIIADEILICVALLIMLTDNVMLKNRVDMIEDYCKVNGLKEKIENYTMMEDRDIEQVELWGKYLSYAVSFGIASKISKRIKGLHIDDDILDLINYNIEQYVISDYSLFYTHASLDRRFIKKYGKKTSNIIKSAGRSGGSSRRWRRFFWRWRIFAEAAAEVEAEELSKK